VKNAIVYWEVNMNTNACATNNGSDRCKQLVRIATAAVLLSTQRMAQI
jgi:hypothetical protein